MKLGELLKNVRELIRDWWFFTITATLLTYAIFTGVVHKKAIVENEFTTYTKFFEDSAKLYGVKINMNNLIVRFVDSYPVQGWVGLCERGNGVSKFVTFKKSYYDKQSVEVKYTLVLHELGHCILNRPHVEGYLKDKCPKSLMHPNDNLFGCFFKNQDYYFKELFGLL